MTPQTLSVIVALGSSLLYVAGAFLFGNPAWLWPSVELLKALLGRKERCNVATKEKELVTAKELAEMFSLTESTVMQWAREGKIPKVQPSPKIIRFEPEAVKKALKKAG